MEDSLARELQQSQGFAGLGEQSRRQLSKQLEHKNTMIEQLQQQMKHQMEITSLLKESYEVQLSKHPDMQPLMLKHQSQLDELQASHCEQLRAAALASQKQMDELKLQHAEQQAKVT